MAQVSLELTGNAQQLVTQVGGLKTDMSELNSETKDFNETSQKGFSDSAKASKKLSDAIEETNKEEKESLGLVEKMQKELNGLKSARDKAHDTKSISAFNKKIQETEKQINQTVNAGKEGFDELGNAVEKSGGKFDSLLDVAGGFGLAFGVQAIIGGIVAIGGAVIETVGEFRTLRGEVQTLTGATGDGLDGIVTSAKAIAETFDIDVNEVIKSANVLSKEFGLTQEEALAKLSSGALGVAGDTQELIEQTKEYASQIAVAGGDADDLFNIINKSATQGVFSDKGIDVVKEFGLRIREQTDGTKEALENAFGKSFTDEIFGGINDGSLTSVEALEKISEKMNDSTIPAKDLQTVIADVFGGAGEDAGIKYLQSLTDISGGVEGLIDETNTLTREQQSSLKAQKDLAVAQNELSKLFDDDSGTQFFTVLETVGTNLLTGFLKPFIDLWHVLTDAFTPLFDALGELKTAVFGATEGFSTMDAFLLPLQVSFKVLGFVLGLIADALVWVVDGVKEFIQESPLMQAIIDGIGKSISFLVDGAKELWLQLSNGFDSVAIAGERTAKLLEEKYTQPLLKQLATLNEAQRKNLEDNLLNDQREIASKIAVLKANGLLNTELAKNLAEKFKANKKVLEEISVLDKVASDKAKEEAKNKAKELADIKAVTDKKAQDNAKKTAEERKKALEKAEQDLQKLTEKLQADTEKIELEGLEGEAKFKRIRENAEKQVDILKEAFEEQGRIIEENGGKEFEFTEEQLKQLEGLKQKAREDELSAIAKFNADKELKAIDTAEKTLDIQEEAQLRNIANLENNGMTEQDFVIFKEEEKLRIEQEFAEKRIKLLEDEIALKKKLAGADGDVSDEEQNEIDSLDNELNAVKDFVSEAQKERDKLAEKRSKVSMAEFLGVTDEEFDDIKERLGDITEQITEGLQNILDAELEASEERLERIEGDIESKQDQLDTELALNEQGFASNVEGKREELDALEKQRQQELKKQESLAKKQFALDTAIQASSLITASANVLKGFSTIPLVGQILGITQVALMVASFFATRASAFSKIKSGGSAERGAVGDKTGMIQGRRHYQGGESFLDHLEVEDGEKFGILSRPATAKHGGLFEKFTLGLNDGRHPSDLLQDLLEGTGVSMKQGIGTRIQKRANIIHQQDLIVISGQSKTMENSMKNVDKNLSELKDHEMSKIEIIPTPSGRWEIDKKNNRKTFIKYTDDRVSK